MIKKIIKKVVKILLIVAIIFVIFLGYQFIQYKNQEKNEDVLEEQSSIDVDFQEELLEEKMQAAKNLVTEINNNVALTILRTSGKITLSHDKTPENNQWLEWLINSDIKVYATYQTAFTIESNLIKATINDDASVTITYNPKDIVLNFIDIQDISTSNNKSIFGSSYTPQQVAALENIARKDIYEYTNSDTNINQAKKNLEMYLTTEAFNYGINIHLIEQ